MNNFKVKLPVLKLSEEELLNNLKEISKKKYENIIKRTYKKPELFIMNLNRRFKCAKV